MLNTRQLFSDFAKSLKSTVTKQANYGILVAVLIAIFSTMFVAYLAHGKITLYGMAAAQRSNFALWMLDVLPMVFGLWGHYVGSVIAFEAGALVVEQTQLLRRENEVLEGQVHHDNTCDPLTDLPNRSSFHNQLEEALINAHSNQKTLAVLLLDLDDFKEVNKTLGHLSGDLVLKQLASRLGIVVRNANILARLGGDEFAVLLTDSRQAGDVELMAQKLCETVEANFLLGGIKLNLLMSIGIVHYPEHGDDADTLMQKAEVALGLAKERKGCSFQTYTPELDNYDPGKLSLMGDLRHAIENGGLLLNYQPKFDLNKRQIIAFEALVRWPHPQHGLLQPVEFISLAERTGLMVPMTYWIMDEALAQCASWQKTDIPINVAVNVPVSVLLDRELPQRLKALLYKHNLAPRHLVLEITESSLMEDQEYALQVLTHISSLGIHISIDDFGTGYSSLSYLRRLPVSEIKIDQTFVMGMLENDNDAVIVNATIGLAHSLGKTVIAEGVAEVGILNKLDSLGCDLVQGYHISPPVDSKQVGLLLAKPEWDTEPIRSLKKVATPLKKRRVE